ncbi:DUF2817 domain-containing protein [Piscinibacter koreensis]|uniref:DUF2817 domain-containing protein n=1 Tax=Piscinibacter koreensis TaxID=2742824 RepID=A0A7Y6NNU9_9BURK|nr:DUF2817 domain-containing protein [Schlegelella koreensis]
MTSDGAGSPAAEDCFAQSYAEARARFLAAASAAGLAVDSHVHPERGRDGETLAMDVVVDGDPAASALLVVSSACHGVEGFCGSAAQVALLGDARLRALARAAGVAVLHIHALNSYGFSWWRRTTHENVDLNRNFHSFGAQAPANAGYDALADALVPASWPPPPEAQETIERFIAEHGERGFQQAVSAGQYRHPDGIFFGGTAPTWSQQTLRAVLRRHASRCRELGWIDWHTGLGPKGKGERIFAGRNDPETLARVQAWWGDVTSTHDGSSTSAMLNGEMWSVAYEECPQARYTGIALEFGTLPIPEVLYALRADQWLLNHPQTDAGKRQAIKRQIRDAFYVDEPEWKAQVIEQSLDATRAGLRGLAEAIRGR